MLILPKDIYDIYREYKQDPTDGKFRPNLVIHVEGNDVYILPITGTSPNNPPKHKDDFWKIEIENWYNAQLQKPSWVMVSELKIVQREVIEKAKYVGPLHDDDWEKVVEKSEEYNEHINTIRKTRSVRPRGRKFRSSL